MPKRKRRKVDEENESEENEAAQNREHLQKKQKVMKQVLTKEVVDHFKPSEDAEDKAGLAKKKGMGTVVEKIARETEDKKTGLKSKEKKNEKRKARVHFTEAEDARLIDLIGGAEGTGFAGGNEWHQYVKDPIFKAHNRTADSLRGRWTRLEKKSTGKTRVPTTETPVDRNKVTERLTLQTQLADDVKEISKKLETRRTRLVIKTNKPTTPIHRAASTGTLLTTGAKGIQQWMGEKHEENNQLRVAHFKARHDKQSTQRKETAEREKEIREQKKEEQLLDKVQKIQKKATKKVQEQTQENLRSLVTEFRKEQELTRQTYQEEQARNREFLKDMMDSCVKKK